VKPGQGLAQQPVKRCLSEGAFRLQLAQHGPHLAFTKAKVFQAGEELGMSRERLRLGGCHAPVVAAVGVLHLKRTGCVSVE